MANFWGLILTGLKTLLTWVVFNNMPAHTPMYLGQSVQDIANTVLGSTFFIIWSQFDMTLPMLLFSWFLGLELGRGIYSIWRFILKTIPFVN